MVLVYSGYRQSEKTIIYLDDFTRHNESILHKFDHVTTLMLVADHNFQLLGIPPEISSDEVKVIFERLQRSGRVAEFSPAHRKIFETRMNLLSKSLSDLLLSKDESEKAQLLSGINQNIRQFRQQMLQIHRQLSALLDSEKALDQLEVSRNLLTELEIHVESFSRQELFDLQRVITPLEIAHSKIEEVLMQKRRRY